MPDGTQTYTPIARWIGIVCWAVIAAFLMLKAFPSRMARRCCTSSISLTSRRLACWRPSRPWC